MPKRTIEDPSPADDPGPTTAKVGRKTTQEKLHQKRLIVILEKAALETIKVGKVYELMNCDKHRKLMLKYKKNPTDYRPDITHQCLLMLLDSPLNRAGLLQVYIHTDQNTLIEIDPQTRIPRTFDRFCGLMVQLLHKRSIHASDGNQKLLKVIKNPVEDHLPTGCLKLGTSFSAEAVVDPREFVSSEPIVFTIGAMAKGSVTPAYTSRSVSISNYPLSAALTCAKLCGAFEEKWGII